MSLVIYPDNLPIPDIAIQGQHVLPLAVSVMEEIGAYDSYRNMTRPYIPASSSFLLEPSELPTFLYFYNTTLNKGIKYFKADWIEWIGLEGYKGRITGFNINLVGVKPKSSIEFEFCPYLRYSTVAPYSPSPWPTKDNA